jgi:ADP-heptose:LPS heptosyltransferase
LNKFKKILIISTNALGDAYLSCSAIAQLNRCFGKVEIDFIANDSCNFFLEYSGLNKIFYLNKKSMKSIFKVLFDVSQIKYDYVFSFFPGLINSFFYISASSVIRSGFVNFRKINEWHNLQRVLYINGKPNNNYIWTPDMNFMDRIKFSLEAVGINSDELKKFTFKLPELNIKKNNSVLFCFSSRSVEKCLPISTVVSILTYFGENSNLKVNVIDIENKLGNFHIKNNITIYNTLSLYKLIELMLSSKTFIGVDSFPIHVAEAYNLNIIGLFAPTNPESVFQSFNDNISILKKNEIRDITSEEIIEKFKQMENQY